MSTIHYGSNSHAECGAEDGLVSLKAAEVTCRTCRGWLPIVAPELQMPTPEGLCTKCSVTGYCADHAKQSDAQRYYDALKRITRYQLPERLAATAEKQYGLEPHEALEMAYDNIQNEASAALHGKRRPKQ